MKIHARRVNDVAVLELAGDLILGEPAAALRRQLYDEMAGGARWFAVNLEKVNYIDSFGVGTILAAHTTAINSGTKCNFFGAAPRVIAILRMVHLDQVLNLFPDETSALSNLSGEERPPGG